MENVQLRYKPTNRVFSMARSDADKILKDDAENYEIVGEENNSPEVEEPKGIYKQVVIED